MGQKPTFSRRPANVSSGHNTHQLSPLLSHKTDHISWEKANHFVLLPPITSIALAWPRPGQIVFGILIIKPSFFSNQVANGKMGAVSYCDWQAKPCMDCMPSETAFAAAFLMLKLAPGVKNQVSIYPSPFSTSPCSSSTSRAAWLVLRTWKQFTHTVSQMGLYSHSFNTAHCQVWGLTDLLLLCAPACCSNRPCKTADWLIVCFKSRKLQNNVTPRTSWIGKLQANFLSVDSET